MDERGRPNDDDKGILDTVRRILSEDQQRSPEPVEARHPFTQPSEPHPDDDVLELEPAMLVDPAPVATRPPEPRQMSREIGVGEQLVGKQAEQVARQSLGSLRGVIREQRALNTHRGGPTIEEIVRDEIRPLLRDWLDANLPALVEQLVRSEITRIVERDGA